MSSTESPFLSDAEVDAICAGLKQNAAKVRYLKDVLKIAVERKPNGRPLVRRSAIQQAQNHRPANGPKWSRAA